MNQFSQGMRRGVLYAFPGFLVFFVILYRVAYSALMSFWVGHSYKSAWADYFYLAVELGIALLVCALLATYQKRQPVSWVAGLVTSSLLSGGVASVLTLVIWAFIAPAPSPGSE